MPRTYSGIPVESGPENGGKRVLLMRANGTSKSFHIRSDTPHLNLEEGFYEIEWEIQEITRANGKLKNSACITKILTYNPNAVLNGDPGDIDYELQDDQSDEIDAENELYDLLGDDGSACVVVGVRFPTDRAKEITNLLWRSSKDETGPLAFNEELQNTNVDICSVYNEISPVLGNKIRELVESTPSWKAKILDIIDTLHHVQAENIGNDTSSLMWILDDVAKIEQFRIDLERVFSEAGFEIIAHENDAA